jgi:hypothetical protein
LNLQHSASSLFLPGIKLNQVKQPANHIPRIVSRCLKSVCTSLQSPQFSLSFSSYQVISPSPSNMATPTGQLRFSVPAVHQVWLAVGLSCFGYWDPETSETSVVYIWY